MLAKFIGSTDDVKARFAELDIGKITRGLRDFDCPRDIKQELLTSLTKVTYHGSSKAQKIICLFYIGLNAVLPAYLDIANGMTFLDLQNPATPYRET